MVDLWRIQHLGAILGCTSAQARCVRPKFFAVWITMRWRVYLDLRLWVIRAKTSYKVKECPSIFGACRGSWSGCQFDWVGAWFWYVAFNCQWVLPRLFAGWLGCLHSGRNLTQPILKNGLRKVKYVWIGRIGKPEGSLAGEGDAGIVRAHVCVCVCVCVCVSVQVYWKPLFSTKFNK